MEISTSSEVTFLFQLGLVRDSVTVDVASLTLKTLKDLACDFITRKVSQVSFVSWIENLSYIAWVL